MDALEKAGKQELCWNGKPARCSEEEAVVILAPLFAAFPNTNADDATFEIYVKMLRDLAPDVLSTAVLKAMNSCKFLPSLAEIREQVERRAPGPHSEANLNKRTPVPGKMFRLDADEDRRQRLERLRETKNWDRYYS
jgi:hypothetical protein